MAISAPMRFTWRGLTNDVEFPQDYELNPGDAQGSDFAKFNNIEFLIESMLSQHELPRSSWAYMYTEE
jgi:hypothetical protein